uniref:Uncharacterized protein n=1 Tax=viral metagenome TaxID=1070528 RepID=A0A6C0LGC5_9ZZZZ
MSQIRIIPGKRSRTCATSEYASQSAQTVFNGNIICIDSGNLITNKQVNSNSDVIVNRTQVERATNSILYSDSGRTQFGNFGSLAEVQAFLKNNQTTPGIYSPYAYLDPKSPVYNYYVNYSTQPNRIPGIRNRF